jgi:hypothetical protein
VAAFALENESYLLGEPVFCDFTLQKTGTRTVAFSYRFPSRVLNRELEPEPRFAVWNERGKPVPDPAPRPCGGAKGSAVYGFVTLPPGQAHRERWLLDQWARLTTPGRYRLRARRRLPLYLDAPPQEAGQRPVAYATVIRELTFEVRPATDAQLAEVFDPYTKVLAKGTGPDVAEAALVVTTLPRPFLLPQLEAMAGAPAHSPAQEQRPDRGQALEGLARLGTPAAWQAISAVARGQVLAGQSARAEARPARDDSLRAYAILLLGEKADVTFLPSLLELVSTASLELRGDALRALGFFHDPRANQVLFERLHSPNASDRVNAILGLKNLESREAIPALMEMLNDSEPQVRRVADFVLESLSGIKIKLSPRASRLESARVADRWHAWWREHGATFVLVRQAACHDW